METGRIPSKNKWLISCGWDIGLLLFPMWFLWLIVFYHSDIWNGLDLPEWAWFVFILFFDVGHVWSTAFRTYWDKKTWIHYRRLYVLTPLLLFVASVALLSFSQLWFWRIMAYFAVFHFMKQQYGFMAIYKNKCESKRRQLLSDKLMIYLVMFVPVVYWHLNSASAFNWFVMGDFFSFSYPDAAFNALRNYFTLFLFALVLLYLLQEFMAYLKKEIISLPKVLWLLTTLLTWWGGIVWFNSDVVFSVSNVVAHGLPYFVLIIFYKYREEVCDVSVNKMPFVNVVKWCSKIVLVVLIFAIVEEYFWDMLIFRDHENIFNAIYPYAYDALKPSLGLFLVIALLALPQQIHYVLDGVIWRRGDKNPFLVNFLSGKSLSKLNLHDNE